MHAISVLVASSYTRIYDEQVVVSYCSSACARLSEQRDGTYSMIFAGSGEQRAVGAVVERVELVLVVCDRVEALARCDVPVLDRAVRVYRSMPAATATAQEDVSKRCWLVTPVEVRLPNATGRTDSEQDVLGLGRARERSEADRSARHTKAERVLRLHERVRELAVVHVEDADRAVTAACCEELPIRREACAKHFGRTVTGRCTATSARESSPCNERTNAMTLRGSST